MGRLFLLDALMLIYSPTSSPTRVCQAFSHGGYGIYALASFPVTVPFVKLWSSRPLDDLTNRPGNGTLLMGKIPFLLF